MGNAVRRILRTGFAILSIGFLPFTAGLDHQRVLAAQETKPLVVDVFWSVRSPYCYIGLDRALEIWEKHKVQTNLRPVYPIAIRDTAFFTDISNYMAYRIPYQGLDTLRSANFNNVPYAYPSPDPVIQAPNFGPVKPSRNRS